MVIPLKNKKYMLSGDGSISVVKTINEHDKTCVMSSKVQRKWGEGVRTVTETRLVPWYYLIEIEND